MIEEIRQNREKIKTLLITQIHQSPLSFSTRQIQTHHHLHHSISPINFHFSLGFVLWRNRIVHHTTITKAAAIRVLTVVPPPQGSKTVSCQLPISAALSRKAFLQMERLLRMLRILCKNVFLNSLVSLLARRARNARERRERLLMEMICYGLWLL